MINSIQVTMFGECSITYGGKTLDGKNVCSKRIWTLIEYLITYRFRCVAKEELIDLLYPEDKTKAPQSALKTVIHRARTTMEGLGYKSGKEIILSCSGGYRWNPEIPVEVDSECFENLTRKAALFDVSEETRLLLKLEAIELYKGDFLPDSSSELWSMSITTYFRFLYMELVHTVIEALKKQGRYSEVISVSKKAISIDPYDESLHANLMLALVKTDQMQAARVQYKIATSCFYDELGITPSGEMKALFKKLLQSDNSEESSIDYIVSQLKEDHDNRGAYFCEYEFFKDIYRIEARSVARSGRMVHVCLISVNAKNGGALTKKTRNAAMQRLSESIKNSLRRGDICSRYSVSQYIILLPLTSYRNSEFVLERIIHKFQRENPCLSVSITYSLRRVEADG